MSCSSRPENAGPPGLNTDRPGGHHCPQRLGGGFFLGNQQNPAKAGLRAKPGTLLPLSSHNSVYKAVTFPQSRRGLGAASRGHADARGWLDGPPGGEKPLPSPRPCSSLLPGVTARCPPNWVGWVRLLSWDEQRFSLDLLIWEETAGAAGFVHPWLGVCSGLGRPQSVLRCPCPP